MQTQQTEALGTAQFRASAGNNHGLGRTPGEALSELLRHAGDALPTPIVIWPYNCGDAYFTEGQQERLLDLRSRSETLTITEREEWEHLAEASLEGAILRSQAVLGNMH